MNIVEMAESHLLNVKRELENLENQRVALDNRIDEVKSYIKDGEMVVLEAKSMTEVVPANRSPV